MYKKTEKMDNLAGALSSILGFGFCGRRVVRVQPLNAPGRLGPPEQNAARFANFDFGLRIVS